MNLSSARLGQRGRPLVGMSAARVVRSPAGWSVIRWPQSPRSSCPDDGTAPGRATRFTTQPSSVSSPGAASGQSISAFRTDARFTNVRVSSCGFRLRRILRDRYSFVSQVVDGLATEHGSGSSSSSSSTGISLYVKKTRRPWLVRWKSTESPCRRSIGATRRSSLAKD